MLASFASSGAQARVWSVTWNGVCNTSPTFQGPTVRSVADQAVSYFNACNVCDHVGSVHSTNEDTGQLVLSRPRQPASVYAAKLSDAAGRLQSGCHLGLLRTY